MQLTQALVVRYPGRGTHEILLHFDAGDRGMKDERMQFGSTVRSADASTPALVGQVLFSGLLVAPDGLSIRLRTINVRSEDDARLLAVLQSDVFRAGLDVAASVGPAIGLLSQTLGSIATYFATRASNMPVQDGLLAIGLQRDQAPPRFLRPRAGTVHRGRPALVMGGLRIRPRARCHRREPEPRCGDQLQLHRARHRTNGEVGARGCSAAVRRAAFRPV